MRNSAAHFISALLFFCLASPVFAQRKTEPLVDQVKKAIDKGVRFLHDKQQENGGWEGGLGGESLKYRGGETALAVLALLNSGVAVDDAMITKGLGFLRRLQPDTTYVRALQTMALSEAGLLEDKERLAENVKWLIDAAIKDDNGQMLGWTYGNKALGNITDNSNTQYAVLGLYAGHVGGATVSNEMWEAIRAFYIRTQEKNGGWVYRPNSPDGSSLTMTMAGLCGLYMTDLAMQHKPELDVNGRPKRCRDQGDSAALADGLAWLSQPGHFGVELKARTFYNLYGIERAGRLSGQRFLAGHDWYREGCDFLVRNKMQDGSWSLRGAWDSWEIVSTSFALLFLSKGRTPVLISKLQHGAFPRKQEDIDWSRHRHDARNLTDYCSKNLFKGKFDGKFPLAWQVFDLMRGAGAEDDLDNVTSDLLQSPILYISGQDAPRFTGIEKDLLKRYIENGGFIMAEACHGSPLFDDGIKDLCRRLWPDNPLEKLSGEHPIWKAHTIVSPGRVSDLYGIQMGCKTVFVYSPQGLSCMWDWNDRERHLGKSAFELGANIVAYATGMEPPKPRLTPVEVARADNEPRSIKRGFLKVAQLKHRGDWQPAPNAMRNLMSHLYKVAGMDVVLKTETMQVYPASIVDFKFVYMHGRADFQFAAEELTNLRFNLENGGLLLADACCGSPVFDKAFRKFAKQLFPKHELEQVKADDILFSERLNGTALTAANIRYRNERGQEPRNLPPFLEGIKINDRWVLLYSKYDLGCALERHNASDCVGYDFDSAQRIAGAAVLYLFEP